MRPQIIAICGLKRSGKDLTADYIEKKYGYEKKKIAYFLKKGIEQIFGISESDLESDNKDKINNNYNVTPRKIMDFIGTEIFQNKINELLPNIGKNFWINRLLKETKNKYIVISDLRFLHEEEELKKLNTLIIKINRKNSTEDNLISEKHTKELKFNYLIENNSSINNLYQKIDEIFKKENIDHHQNLQ